MRLQQPWQRRTAITATHRNFGPSSDRRFDSTDADHRRRAFTVGLHGGTRHDGWRTDRQRVQLCRQAITTLRTTSAAARPRYHAFPTRTRFRCGGNQQQLRRCSTVDLLGHEHYNADAGVPTTASPYLAYRVRHAGSITPAPMYIHRTRVLRIQQSARHYRLHRRARADEFPTRVLDGRPDTGARQPRASRHRPARLGRHCASPLHVALTRPLHLTEANAGSPFGLPAFLRAKCIENSMGSPSTICSDRQMSSLRKALFNIVQFVAWSPRSGDSSTSDT